MKFAVSAVAMVCVSCVFTAYADGEVNTYQEALVSDLAWPEDFDEQLEIWEVEHRPQGGALPQQTVDFAIGCTIEGTFLTEFDFITAFRLLSDPASLRFDPPTGALLLIR